ncbi:hypothetical protein KA005_53315, partial [bacterium]|nr:hypothetical protein [bacterium]
MNSNTMKLYGLAMNKFGKITKAEMAFFQAVANAEHVSYKKDAADEPIIRASCIAWICKDPQASSMVKNCGIGINGARIEEDLELSYAKIPFPINFQNCVIPGKIILYDAEIHSLGISQSYIGSVDANRMKVIFSVILSGTEAKAGVSLANAEIGLNLNCHNGHFINNEGKALMAEKLKVRGSVILSDEFKAEGEVDLRGAIIGGSLECVNGKFINQSGIALNAYKITVNDNVFLRESFRAEGMVDLRVAQIGGDLECHEGQFINSKGRALCVERVKVEGSVYLLYIKAKGEVSIAGSNIMVNLECDNAQLINKDGRAFFAQQLIVGGHVFFRNVQAEGHVIFSNAKILGNLECSKSQFINRGAKAFSAEKINVEGDIFLRDAFRAEGEVNLLNATIGGDLACRRGHFINKGKNALLAEKMEVGGSVYFTNAEIFGKVSFIEANIDKFIIWRGVTTPKEVILDLRYSNIGTLSDDKNCWPEKGKLLLDGLVYDGFSDNTLTDFETRIDWLRLQPKNIFLPQPFEQLASVFRKSGRDKDAKRILIEKNKDKIWLSQMGVFERLRHRFLGYFIDYGYQPWKAIWWALVIVALGCVVFGIGFRKGIISPKQEMTYVSDRDVRGHISMENYPKFNSIIYSLDMFVPLIDLHMANYWLPNANKKWQWCISEKIKLPISGILRTYLWIHIIAGWIITTFFIVGLTGLIKK